MNGTTEQNLAFGYSSYCFSFGYMEMRLNNIIIQKE